MIITIFTPTYNRGYILSNLYESLKRQTCKNFEWLVVDDGSTDNTSELFRKWIHNADFPIRYFRQENSGKHVAINLGVQKAAGELFFIVDSDDCLEDFAIEYILAYSETIREDCAGLCFHRCSMDRHIIGSPFPQKIMFATSLDMSYKYKVKGDRAEVFRTDILRNYAFPTFKNENFIPEALIWNRISMKHKLLFVDEAIYLCEYLPDGLTVNFQKNLQRNPKGFGLYYSELLRYQVIPLREKLKVLIRILQCFICFVRNFVSNYD